MLLYHAGHHRLPNPDIRIGRKNADFGQGFYLSPGEEFLGKWLREHKDEHAWVNVYELDLSGLRVRHLHRDGEWYDTIRRNRAGLPGPWGEEDVIIGPIANDTVYNTYGIFTSGLLPKAQALALLRIGPEYEQVAVKTDRARAQLRWLSARELEQGELAALRAQLLREEAEYQQALAEAYARLEDGAAL